MNQLVSDNLWKELSKLARGKRCIAAVAYVTSDDYLKFGRNDTLVTDASDATIRGGMTSAKVLYAAHRRGTKIFSLPGLHAKILVCGRTAVIGSANLSASSAENLIEAVAMTDDATLVAQAASFVDQLTSRANPIDDHFLKHILRIKVERKGTYRIRGTKVKVRIPGKKAWLVSVRELAAEAHPEESTKAEAGKKKARNRLSSTRNDVSWIRYTGKDQFARYAREGDIVIQIWRSLGGTRATVLKHSPILYRQKEEKCVRLYVEEYQDEDETAIQLSKFRTLARRAGIARKIGPNSTREISQNTASVIQKLWPSK